MVTEVEHAGIGKMKTIGFPIKFSASRASVVGGAPTLGQHTREVLREHGYKDEGIEELAAAGVIICG